METPRLAQGRAQAGQRASRARDEAPTRQGQGLLTPHGSKAAVRLDSFATRTVLCNKSVSVTRLPRRPRSAGQLVPLAVS